jgi:hypothetical protein
LDFLRNMKIAFDYGGVLAQHEWIRDMAKALLKDGHEVYCITAAPNSIKETGQREKEVAAFNIPFTKVFVTYHPDHVTHQVAYEVGHDKALVMKQNNIEILIDDLPPIIQAVRQHGLIGLHVG